MHCSRNWEYISKPKCQSSLPPWNLYSIGRYGLQVYSPKGSVMLRNRDARPVVLNVMYQHHFRGTLKVLGAGLMGWIIVCVWEGTFWSSHSFWFSQVWDKLIASEKREWRWSFPHQGNLATFFFHEYYKARGFSVLDIPREKHQYSSLIFISLDSTLQSALKICLYILRLERRAGIIIII